MGSALRAIEARYHNMTRFIFIIPIVLMASSASAQQSTCTRDVSRFCRQYMNDGDMVVLQCLKQNRARLSKGCQATLTANGQ
jgi:hypothetical protein